MSLDVFSPLIGNWFRARFREPTEPQQRGWGPIAAGRNTLIAAPTGSGKTLAAFLVAIDGLIRRWRDGHLQERIHVVYVSPLKALSNDIQRNLETPLTELGALSEAEGWGPLPLRVAVRTGDTTASQRQAMLKRPPHILVTTPESLYLLITSEKGRERLATVETVIVDEIHALARDKRGSHLALTLERLEELCPRPLLRIGLSATQRPIEEIAHFLVGERASPPCDEISPKRQCGKLESSSTPTPTRRDERRHAPCAIVDVGHMRDMDLGVEVPATTLAAVCSHEQWAEIYAQLLQLIESHRSTLIFVNTRRLAERVAHSLRERLGEDAVAGHHGSMSRDRRFTVEQRLKTGQLKAIVATASLEMGIDIGYLDLVCQIGSPRSIATFLQRVGRSGHSLDATPKGRLFPLSRDELLECVALIGAVRRADLDRIEIPRGPLDILAQQIVAEVACRDWDETSLFCLCRRAAPYRELTRSDFDAVLTIVSEGISANSRRGAFLHRDRIGRRLRARRGARLAALTSGGAIPEAADYRVVIEDEKTVVGSVDEDFAIESLPGDVFLLGNTSWRIRRVRQGEVIVSDAHGAPPSIPFWFGESPGRTAELSHAISTVRSEIAARVSRPGAPHDAPSVDDDGSPPRERSDVALPAVERINAAAEWLQHESGIGREAAIQAVGYVAAQQAAIGLVPSHKDIVFERFFDESGGMQLVIHSVLGARINRAWGLALRKRFCRSFDFELQAAATDNGILLSLGPQHSFAIDSLFKMLGPHNARHLLEQAVLAAPFFQIRWRWNVTRALAVLRRQGGKKVPPHLQRFRSDDLLAEVFPQTVGCLENHHGDVEIPDHPLVEQTMRDCMSEAMDLQRWMEVLGDVEAGDVKLIPHDTREPSPFCHEILNANPYAFLDDAPLEERRTRAVTARRTLAPEDFHDLGRLDPDAIRQVCTEAWPVVRDGEELHDALVRLVLVTDREIESWESWLPELVREGRAVRVEWQLDSESANETFTESETSGLFGAGQGWIACERWPVVRAALPSATCAGGVELPSELNVSWGRTEAVLELLKGRVSISGPSTAGALAAQIGIEETTCYVALEALEGHGVVLRGAFSAGSKSREFTLSKQHPSIPGIQKEQTEWCDRRLLARIHRLTLSGLRRQIRPVAPADFSRFLFRHQGVSRDRVWSGPTAIRELIGLLQGYEMPAAAWEWVLATRISDYDPAWLDQLFLAGEVVWGRLRSPKRDANAGRSMAIMTRVMPISLMLREDLDWLVPPEPDPEDAGTKTSGLRKPGHPDNGGNTRPPRRLRANAEDVRLALTRHGALFFQELLAVTELLPGHLEEALRELAAQGMVNCDTYSVVRSMVGNGRRARGRRRRKNRTNSPATPSAGRWTLFPRRLQVIARRTRCQHWAQLLLRRYGVVFRDLLVREAVAPPWHELVRFYRQLELRGQVRGGRFVDGVSGEQFALENAVAELRQARDEASDEKCYIISAADPLNLTGSVLKQDRVPATHSRTLVFRNGCCVARRIDGRTTWNDEADTELRQQVSHALHWQDHRSSRLERR